RRLPLARPRVAQARQHRGLRAGHRRPDQHRSSGGRRPGAAPGCQGGFVTVYVSVVIDAAPDAVWATVEQLEHHVDWMADADVIRFDTEQRRGVGTRLAVETCIGPFRYTDHVEVVEWIEGAVIGVR